MLTEMPSDREVTDLVSPLARNITGHGNLLRMVYYFTEPVRVQDAKATAPVPVGGVVGMDCLKDAF